MKIASMALLLLIFFLLFFPLTLTYASPVGISTTTVSSSADVQIDHVNHRVEIQGGGFVIINDTFGLSNGGLLQNFTVGFPFEYGFNLDYCFAYEASNPDERLEVKLDVGLGRIGFYGVNVVFPEPGVNMSDVGLHTFTVVSVFSNLISSKNETSFTLDFPLYPSLAQEASLCNVTVVLPPNANYTGSTLKKSGHAVDFNATRLGPTQILDHIRRPIDSYQHEPAELAFDMIANAFPLIDANEMKREIELDEWGGIHLSDFYHLTNKGPQIEEIIVSLPEDAFFDPKTGVRDKFGNFPISPSVEKDSISKSAKVTIHLRNTLTKDEETRFTLTYTLPWENYVNHYNWRNYDLSFMLLEQFDWTIRKLVVTITLPEGAEFKSSTRVNPQSVRKSMFHDAVAITFFNVTRFHDLGFDLTYEHHIFWSSFYPTLWMGLLVTIICVAVLIWRRVPKAPTVPMILISPEVLRSFVDAYEEKTKILSEFESTEERLRRGRIPRRRYKIRKKTLEGRLSAISRELASLREKIRVAGPRYANIMGQVEVAEALLEGVERDIRRVEARYRSGEISKGAYRRLVSEYERRKERANTTIDGVLIRLREEIRSA